MIENSYKLMIFILFDTVVKSEICSICNCMLVNVKSVNPELENNFPAISFEFDAEDIESFDLNNTFKVTQKYFYVDCSGENNVGQINNIEWPTLDVPGIFANFKSSKWKKLEFFPSDIKKKMTVLSLSNNLISNIEVDDLYNFNNLKMLNLSENQISTVRKSAFNKLNLLKLLDLSQNTITELHDWAFYGADLRYLNLSSNMITTVTPDTFRGLNNLLSLDLSKNNMNRLPDNFGSLLPSLVTLFLNGNSFSKLPEIPKRLKKLNLSNNQFTELHLVHSTLEILNVENNELVSLTDTTAPALKVLEAGHNNLTQLDIKCHKIEILNLSHNKFHVIPEDVASDKLLVLKEFYLDGNPIDNVSLSLRKSSFENLRVLSLANCRIKKLSRHSLQGFFSNYSLDCSKNGVPLLNLSNNLIEYADKEVFKNFTICSIDLSQNYLKSLPETFLPWRKMSHVDLQQNPWQCDCSIQWMLKDFMVFMYTKHPKLLFDLKCSTPARYKNKPLAFWYNRSEDVFCKPGPSSLYFDLFEGKTIEMWTASAITCILLGCIIFVTLMVILVLLCRKPTKKRRQKIMKKGRKSVNYKPVQWTDGINTRHGNES